MIGRARFPRSARRWRASRPSPAATRSRVRHGRPGRDTTPGHLAVDEPVREIGLAAGRRRSCARARTGARSRARTDRGAASRQDRSRRRLPTPSHPRRGSGSPSRTRRVRACSRRSDDGGSCRWRGAPRSARARAIAAGACSSRRRSRRPPVEAGSRERRLHRRSRNAKRSLCGRSREPTPDGAEVAGSIGTPRSYAIT